MDAAPPIDAQSTCLQIGLVGITIPSDQDGWRASGECIGSHEHLQELEFWGIDTAHKNLEALLIGVNQNRTVRELKFYRCHGEWPLGILEIFFRDNQNLSLLKVVSCRGDFISSLSTSLRGRTSRFLHITCNQACNDCGRVGEDFTEFIEALDGLPQLEKLELIKCNIRRRGCDALAASLRSPACMLQEISLDHSGINDEDLAVLEPAVAVSSTLTELSLCGIGLSTTALQSFSGILRNRDCMLKCLDIRGNCVDDDAILFFAGALGANRRLEKLVIGRWHRIFYIGFAAMTRALCDTSSIADVHASNHTLQHLDLREMPNDLRNYLRMNELEDKSLVARDKIFMHFLKGNFSMEPFHENKMTPNILPHLLGWIGKMPDEASFTALFSFLQRMPSRFGVIAGRERKV